MERDRWGVSNLAQHAEPVWRGIADDLELKEPDLDDIEINTGFQADEDPDPLYDSRRDYITQIDRYKEHQGAQSASPSRACA